MRTLFLACRQLSAKIDGQLFPTLTPLPSGAGPWNVPGSLARRVDLGLSCVTWLSQPSERGQDSAPLHVLRRLAWVSRAAPLPGEKRVPRSHWSEDEIREHA